MHRAMKKTHLTNRQLITVELTRFARSMDDDEEGAYNA